MSVAIVTGSAGLIGSETCKKFHAEGFDVVGIDNDMRAHFFGPDASTSKTRELLQQTLGRYTHRALDIRDRDDIERLFRQLGPAVKVVVHTAAQPSHDWAARDPHTDFSVNALGTLNLLEATRQHCPEAGFIFTSTNKVYGDTPNRLPLIELDTHYDIDPAHIYHPGIDETMSIDQTKHSLFGASKAAADLLVQEYGVYFGMKTACFRGGCLTGPAHAGTELHGFLSYLMKCTVLGMPYRVYGYKGKQVRDNIHSFDLVNAFWEFFKAPRSGEVYNMGGSRHSCCSMLQAIAACERISGRKLNWTYVEDNRIGDHIWWVSNVAKFQSHYPAWSYRYDMEGILREIHDVLQAGSARRWQLRLSDNHAGRRMKVDLEIETAQVDPAAGLHKAELPEGPPSDLKRRTALGALASSASQASTMALRVVSMVILARLLSPEDFGLVGMVTAVTGFIARFKEAGLSDAAVQSVSVNQDQLSMLFWINASLGCGLGLLCAAGAHTMASFYGEPRLFWIMLAMGTSFVFTGLATQHRAVLLRNMRIQVLAAIDIVSLLVSMVVSIAMAAAGYGYWALVASAILYPAGNAVGLWLATGWVPSRPRRNSGVRQMVIYGGTVTLNSVVVYLAYNVDKILLGRYWGAEVLGIYGRAYTLVNLPTDSLHTTVGAVAFPALSRVQTDPKRFRSYFLTIYSVFLSIALPVTVACALFADDIVLVFLGPKWHEAASVFRLLAPTILSFAVINPFGWLMFANGRVSRSLKIALMIAPVTILSYVLGLGYGSKGVAVGFSVAMVVLVIPVVLWAKRDTLITTRDAFKALAQPSGSILAGVALALLAGPWVNQVAWPLLRLTISCSLMFGGYLVVLLFVFGQKRIYIQLLQETGLWPSWLRRPAVSAS